MTTQQPLDLLLTVNDTEPLVSDLDAYERSNASSREHHDLLQELQVDPTVGLSISIVEARQKEFGLNELDDDEEESIIMKFIGQFNDPLILLLLCSGVVSIAMGHTDDAISIGIAITIVVTVAFVQEYRSEKTLEALKELVPPQCKVLRDGDVLEIYARELVPGDIIVINVGDRIPADARLIEAIDLEVDESNLTGETLPVVKHTNAIESAHMHPIAERKNIVYMGTLVRGGRGRAVVFATGAKTEFGVVFSVMHSVEERKTPLQVSMDNLGRQLSFLSIGIITIIVVIGILQGKGLLKMLQIGVSLAVAAIPEGLPICVTVTLAFGVMKMAKRHAIVKKLPAVEALGCISVVCVDKTGTITTNKMEVIEIFVPFESVYAEVHNVGKNHKQMDTEMDLLTQKTLGEEKPQVTMRGEGITKNTHPHVFHCLLTGALCNNASIAKDGEVIGQATDGAILLCAKKVGIHSNVTEGHDRLSEVPFSSDKKWMAVCCEAKDTRARAWYLKGMTEAILSRCDKIEDNCGRYKSMAASDRERILVEASAMAARGLRVIALAFGEFSDREMVFAGLLGISDPPRLNVEKSIAMLNTCGVTTVMLTGDSKETAVAIAKQVGIIHESDLLQSENGESVEANGIIMSGAELERINPIELEKNILQTRVFYRTVPSHKLKIVQAFQAAGLQVAMTGDGVNDAPALKAADIGVAMGTSGTDVSKEASDMILLDDNFNTILNAIEEGKSIYHNIRHFLRFQLSTSIAALSLIAISTLFNLPNPLNAMQILWINIIMDGPPAQSLGVEPVDHDVMKQGPRARDSDVITPTMIRRILTSSTLIVAGTLYVFYQELNIDGTISRRDRTMSFTTFVMFDMFNALSCRSDDKSVFDIGLLSNKAFAYAVGASILGQLLVIFFPPLQSAFQTEALSLSDLVYILGISSSVLIVDEFRKMWEKKMMPQFVEVRRPAILGKRTKRKKSWDGQSYDTV